MSVLHSYVQDNHGHTPYDVATLHGRFECARLLRALQWAKGKDEQLNAELQERVERQRREQEIITINSQLRKEATDRAYQQWAIKSQVTHEPPFACGERQSNKSQTHTHTCSSCKTGTRIPSARQSVARPASYYTKISLHQAKRNVECTGKPSKMHPYTNYPPRKRPKSVSSRTAGHSSRATSSSFHTPTPANHTIDSGRQQQVEATQQQQGKEELTGTPECAHIKEECDSREAPECEYPPSELNLGFLKNSRDNQYKPEEGTVQFLIGGAAEEGEYIPEYEEDEDIPFHDVGKTNSLNSLSLPVVLTRDRTPAEVMKLLRYLGSDQVSGLHSHTPRFRRQHSLSFQRRFSLGAIPEGQVVTNYSNESMASLDEQSARLRFMELSPRGSTAWVEEEEEETEDSQLQTAESKDEPQWSSDSSSNEGDNRQEVGKAENDSKEGDVISPCIVSTLNIVNFVWDMASNSVQTRVTRTPMRHLRQPSPSRPVSPHSPCPAPPSNHSTYSTTAPTPPKPNQTCGAPPRLSRSLSLPPMTHLHELEQSDTSPPPDKSPPSSPRSVLPHSLFGSGIASKSMISLSNAVPSDGQTNTIQQLESSSLKLKPRIMSAPNMLHMHAAGQSQALKTSV